jgi:CheY-like chemotaxis protein
MSANTILVIEDDWAIREFLKARLEEAAFRVMVAGDATAALQLLESERPDLILTDLLMPLVAGEQLISILRNREGYAEIPIVVLTAYSHAFGQAALAAGATVVLKKPQDITRVVETVRQLLGQPAKNANSP